MNEPPTFELIVDNYLNGKRIDTFLARHFRCYTSWRLQRLVRAGQVYVEDLRADCNQRVFRGQHVRVRLTEPPDRPVEPAALPLEILYEDPWIVVINKHPDQITHPGGPTQHGTVLNALQHHLDQQTVRRGLLRPGIVHRIDRYTSGLLVAAKDHLSHRKLTMHFEKRRVYKAYLALAHGVLETDFLLIDRPIGLVVRNGRKLMSTADDAEDRRPAWTAVSVLERLPGATLVSAHPLTGRPHQIRVHLASIGHPILGDEYYGPDWPGIPLEEEEPESEWTASGQAEERAQGQSTRAESARETPATAGRSDGSDQTAPSGPDVVVTRSTTQRLIDRQALHAYQLCFRHPITEEWMTFEAPLPEDMRQAVERLRRSE